MTDLLRNRMIAVPESRASATFAGWVQAHGASVLCCPLMGILDAPQAPLADLRPELAVLVPVQPNLSPFCLRVGSEGDRAAKAVLPMSQQRIAFVGNQWCLGAGLLARGDVA